MVLFFGLVFSVVTPGNFSADTLGYAVQKVLLLSINVAKLCLKTSRDNDVKILTYLLYTPFFYVF